MDKFKEQARKHIVDQVQKVLEDYAETLVSAAVTFRYAAPGAHNFTGNLLNSIVVVLCREGVAREAFYASGNYVRKAIRRKMTHPYTYRFSRDHDNQESQYTPETKTDQGLGEDDAVAFFHRCKPRGGLLFEIIVGYTTEYADFVENNRHTTGIINTYKEAYGIGITFMKRA